MNNDFGNWFAGLTDGEGCFKSYTNRRTRCLPQPQFTISLRDDDRPMLEYIRDQLGFGYLSRRPEFQSREGYISNPTASLIVIRREDTGKLVELFRKYPLRSKKARDFELWAKIVEIRNRRDWRGRPTPTPDSLADMQEIQDLTDLLHQVKKYQVGKVP